MGLIKSRTDDDSPSLAPEHHGPVDMFSWKPHDSAADLVQDSDSSPPLSLSVSSSTVAEAPWSVAEWAVALRFDHPRATVLVLLLG